MKRKVEKDLIVWKDNPNRKPLIIRGARQVGKTYVIEDFGSRFFDNVVTINFEVSADYAHCFAGDLEPKRILSALELVINRQIVPGKTLLFLDEIQLSARAITALRYFKEKMPALHVIAAGSLLEFIMEEENFSWPVGRVQFMHMHPLSFTEYLKAAGYSMLANSLQHATLDNPPEAVMHNILLDHVRDYFYVGGMPEIVKNFIKNRSFIESQTGQVSLLQTYQNDLAKYGKRGRLDLLQKLFEGAPGLVGKHFKYSKIAPEVHTRELKKALDQLGRAGLLTRIYHTNASGLPLRAKINEKKFKLLLLDVGLMQASLRSLPELKRENLLAIHQGAVAEQFVGQQLLAMVDPHWDARLHFWEREKKSSSAEVDYVINIQGTIVPIEVKAGATGRLRSLRQFMEEKQIKRGVRIAELPLGLDQEILSIPFYLIDQIPRLIGQMQDRGRA